MDPNNYVITGAYCIVNQPHFAQEQYHRETSLVTTPTASVHGIVHFCYNWHTLVLSVEHYTVTKARRSFVAV